jgi:arabinofuranosyltransferase
MASPSANAGRGPQRSWSSWAVVGLALPILVAFFVHLGSWEFLCDDAYIAFRYARNWAEHGEPVFNIAPYEQVEGYTSFGFVAVLAGGQVLGMAPHDLAPGLVGAAGLACLVLVTLVARALRVSFSGGLQPARLVAFDLVPASVLVLMPEFVVWSSGGLETSIAVALGLGGVLAWLRKRPVLAALIVSAAGLTRLDSLLWIAAFGLAWLLVKGIEAQRSGGLRLSRFPWPRLAVALLVFALPLAGHALWRHEFYGAWLPNTWAVKSSGALLRDTWGRAYLLTWASALQLAWMLPLLLAFRLRHVIVVAAALASVVYAWSVGGDFMAYSRFLLPATVMVSLLVGWCLADLRVLIRHQLGRRAPVAELAWLGVILLFAIHVPGRVQADHERNHLEGRWESVQAMDRFARVRLAAGAVMAEELPADTWVTVGAAGAMPYASRLPAYDSYGLVDPGVKTVAKVRTGKGARPGHQLHAPMKYMRSRGPDLMCHVGTDWTRRPRRADARKRVRRGWHWACFETGPIEDPRSQDGTMESRFYCCLAPDDGAEARGRKSG